MVNSFKPALIPYEWVINQPNEQFGLFLLSERTRATLFAITDTIYWRTRWDNGALGVSDEQYQQILSTAENLERELLDMIDFCEQVANCIENSADVRNALGKFLGGYNRNGSEEKEREIREGAEQKTDDILSFEEGGVCDKDALFACVSQMITLLHENNLDALEILEAQTNANVELASVVSQITVVDELSIDAIFSYANFIQESISDNYSAAYTDELFDKMRCDIFCIAQEECGLSIDILFDYFRSKISLSGVPVDDIINLISFFTDILDGSFISEQVVYFMFFSQLALVKLADGLLTAFLQGDNSLNVANRLNIQIKAFSNDSDPDWAVLCSDCNVDYTWLVNTNASIVSQTDSTLVFTATAFNGGVNRAPVDGSEGVTINSLSFSGGDIGVLLYSYTGLIYANFISLLTLPVNNVTAIFVAGVGTLSVGFTEE